MTENYKKRLTGRPPKLNPCTHCVMVRFNDDEYEKFMARYRESGVYAKAVFCKAMVFGESFRVIREDEEMRPFSEKLNDYHTLFRTLAMTYNQVVKEMHVNFSERRTIALLNKLEKATTGLTAIAEKVIRLAHEAKKKEFELGKYKNT